MTPRPKTKEIQDFVLNQVGWHAKDIARVTAKQFKLSRSAVTRHLNNLIKSNQLRATGATRDRSYEAIETEKLTETLKVSADLEEDNVWRTSVVDKIEFGKPNVREICYHGFTEMLNNVIDHSQSDRVLIQVSETEAYVDMQISDFGVGIFRKIREAFNLGDDREAILELSKGKLTTDPTRHSGEGVFFTSRMFDYFSILSGGLYFSHRAEGSDWLIEGKPGGWQGTSIEMRISKNSDRTKLEVFNTYSSVEAPGFSKTHVPLSLAQYGEDNLVSRSQAKRVLARFNRFSEVLLNFDGVESIGQAFADEIFRVFRNQHPEIQLLVIQSNPEIDAMIARVSANSIQIDDDRQKNLPFTN